MDGGRLPSSWKSTSLRCLTQSEESDERRKMISPSPSMDARVVVGWGNSLETIFFVDTGQHSLSGNSLAWQSGKPKRRRSRKKQSITTTITVTCPTREARQVGMREVRLCYLHAHLHSTAGRSCMRDSLHSPSPSFSSFIARHKCNAREVTIYSRILPPFPFHLPVSRDFFPVLPLLTSSPIRGMGSYWSLNGLLGDN